MKLKAIWKDTFRELSQSTMRFLAILIIILLGVGFFVGISATGPNMIDTADDYYQQLNLMDYRVVSTYGITEEDIQKLETLPDIDIQSHYAYDFIEENYAEVIRLYSFDLNQEEKINQYAVIEGRLPETKNEIALDHRETFLEGIKIGDTISLDDSKEAGNPRKNLTQTQFEVVGFVNSPLFIEKISRGASTIGDGNLDGFGVIAQENYNTDYHTDVYLQLKNKDDSSTYSETYKNLIIKNKEYIEDTIKEIEERRTEEIKDEIQKELNDGWDEIKDAKLELQDAEKQLNEARQELDEGWIEFEEEQENFDFKIKDAQKEINQNKEELNSKQNELNTQEKDLQMKKEELEEKNREVKEQKKQLEKGIQEVDKGSEQIEDALKEIDQNERKLNEELTQINQFEKEALAGKEFLEAQLEYASGDEKEAIRAQIKEVDEGLKEISSNKAKIQDGLKQVAKKREKIVDQPEQLINQKKDLQQKQKKITQGQKKIEQGLNEINTGMQQIADGKTQIDSGFSEIKKAQQTLDEEKNNGQVQLDEARKELDKAEKEYEKNLNEFKNEHKNALEDIEKGEKELEETEDDLETMAMPEYHLFDRRDNQGYLEYEDNADRLAIIAKVFPVFFFLIAIFISFTTMTRMVDEEREYIGIMKALGYGNHHILIKFITYSVLATTIGALLGLVIGYILLPKLIFFAYSGLYNFPKIRIQQHTLYTVISMFAAYLSTVGASLLAVKSSLKSNTATLLQPKAPKSGSRIWLEKIPLIWKKFSFNQKITFRNVFRYKARMLMTIFGIAGSTGLILTGFGVSDSIRDIPDIQYGEINQFQAYVALDEEVNHDNLNNLQREIDHHENIQDQLFIRQENMTTNNNEINKQDLTLFVPSHPDEINNFVLLRDYKSKEILDLKDSGAYITQKLAQLLNINIGETIEVINNEDQLLEVKIAGIVENYIGHFIYLTPKYYNKISKDETYESNIQLIKYTNDTNISELGEELMEKSEVIGISYVSEFRDAFADTLHSLDLITHILVISAAALAFIVLYNLTNINVSERQRELSTIKVLGSYDTEVTLYIYRENLILTLLGIFFGLGFGTILTRFIMRTMEVDLLVFGRVIHPISYFYASLLTLLFSLIVMLVIHFQLKKIDMVEALKAND